ncbi:SRPBCC family protein [Tsukamurella soli]|uniref:Polyketide cyclase / dehydrase and lipid transport n=1 Tax=Tsukamurella soli TaxID=644556 RepID=A0ABP8J201_9ACTN
MIADLPRYPTWLPASGEYASTTGVEPYPVRLGSRYHDGRTGEPGKDWWGSVTGFQRPGSLDFHHAITVSAARATVEVNIHYAFEAAEDQQTDVSRWLLLTITMPVLLLPARRVIVSRFDRENVRTMRAVEAHFPADGTGG